MPSDIQRLLREDLLVCDLSMPQLPMPPDLPAPSIGGGTQTYPGIPANKKKKKPAQPKPLRMAKPGVPPSATNRLPQVRLSRLGLPESEPFCILKRPQVNAEAHPKLSPAGAGNSSLAGSSTIRDTDEISFSRSKACETRRSIVSVVGLGIHRY
jgi:hypothetical protein